MAKKKSSTTKAVVAAATSSPWVWKRLAIILATLVTSGGVGGWAMPDMPILGPMVQGLFFKYEEKGELTQDDVREAIDDTLVRLEQQALHQTGPVATPASATGAPLMAQQVSQSGKPVDRISIASYNIQVFGTEKLSDPNVVAVLADVVRHFDIVAIQEVRSKDDSILPRFVSEVNKTGSRYDFVIGPRLGRTNSKEQYAFVYDTTRVEVNPASVATVPDPQDYLHREPLYAQFRTKAYGPERAFTFWLVDIHTDPDDVPHEVDALAKVFTWIKDGYKAEDDVILLGDLNANESQLGQLAQIPGIHWVVRGVTTNTRHTAAYDNILFDSRSTTEFTGRWGVVDVRQIFNLTDDQALKVSDHFPIWAEFYAYETPNQMYGVANRPGTQPASR
ncbi:MAG: endonuclease/exonuclease/phosphatase family protein [Pirellulales bacterium]